MVPAVPCTVRRWCRRRPPPAARTASTWRCPARPTSSRPRSPARVTTHRSTSARSPTNLPLDRQPARHAPPAPARPRAGQRRGRRCRDERDHGARGQPPAGRARAGVVGGEERQLGGVPVLGRRDLAVLPAGCRRLVRDAARGGAVQGAWCRSSSAAALPGRRVVQFLEGGGVAALGPGAQAAANSAGTGRWGSDPRWAGPRVQAFLPGLQRQPAGACVRASRTGRNRVRPARDRFASTTRSVAASSARAFLSRAGFQPVQRAQLRSVGSGRASSIR